MGELESRIESYLKERNKNLLLRQLTVNKLNIDFTSNDYLGRSRSAWVKNKVEKEAKSIHNFRLGSTGSRLLSGNYNEIEELEFLLAKHFKGESALFFNTGFNANVGLLSTLPQKGDLVIYDEHIHASLHQGLNLSKSYKTAFKHNDIADLEAKLKQNKGKVVFVIVESIYSMDGDYCPLEEIVKLKALYPFELIVDEAHSGGVVGEQGSGLTCKLHLESACLARIFTFGKAFGAHGSAVITSNQIKKYLINFCKNFIYTTAPPLHEILTVKHSIIFSQVNTNQQLKLYKLINYFIDKKNQYPKLKIIGEGPIFAVISGSNNQAKQLSQYLKTKDIDARPILSPTVPKGTERIRICLHAFNKPSEIDLLFKSLAEYDA